MCNISYQLKASEHFRISNQSFLCSFYHSLLHCAYLNYSSFFSWSNCIFWFAKSLCSNFRYFTSAFTVAPPGFCQNFLHYRIILHRECNLASTDKIEYPSRLGRRCNGRQAGKLIYAWGEKGEKKKKKKK